MNTLQLTKCEARQAIYTWQWAKEDLKNKDLNYVERQAKTYNEKYDNIKEENDVFLWVRNSEGNTYILTIDVSDHTHMNVYDNIKINGHDFSVGYLLGFLNDIPEEEQRKNLENLYLNDIEKYLSERTGRQIKLKSMVTRKNKNYQLDLYTDDLVNKSGICKAMFKNLYIESRNNGYYIDKYDGEQKLNVFVFYFKYEHQDGGYNGHEMGKVRWNEKEVRFEGYNYDNNTYEVI